MKQQTPSSQDSIVMPAMMIPSWKTFHAEHRGVLNNILIKAWGGLGDVICAEPAIRYAKTLFPDCKINLGTHHPELFSHLSFDSVYDFNVEIPDFEKYFVFETIHPPEHLLWQFVSHMLSHPVDFSSICMWRMMLPIANKEIQLPDFEMTEQVREALDQKNAIVIHAGKHWQSKTFPQQWWDDVVTALIERGFNPILIGKTDKDGPHGGTGYVDLDPADCTDLRDKLSMKEFVTICKNAKYLLSNDSSPIHAAASGDAFIGMIASCKHPDYLMHWRKGQFGYKTKNFGLDGVWNHINHGPNVTQSVEVEKLPDGLMEKILPDPKVIAQQYKEWVMMS